MTGPRAKGFRAGAGYLPLAGAPQDPVAWGSEPNPDDGRLSVVSYQELCARARAVAELVPAAGEVLLLCEDRYWFTAALLGAWQAGCPVVLPPHRGAEVVTRLAAGRFVLHDGDAATFEPSLDVRRTPVVQAPAFLDPIEPERHLLTLYTSGSTGEPIAWLKRARQILGEAQALVRQLGFEPTDRVLPSVAPHHIYGLLFGVLVPLAAGASFVRSTPLHAQTLLACAERTGARWLVSVPAHLQVLAPLLQAHLAAANATAGSETWSARRIVSSGAVLRDDIARALGSAGFEVIDVLGSTETGGLAIRRAGLETAWTPLEPVRIQVGPDQRLMVQSPFLERPDEWHTTGDRGSVDADGRFQHLGRFDDVVKIGGKRTTLGEIEACVRELPGVRDVAALRHPVGGIRGEEIWAAMVAPGLTPQTIREALRERLDPVFVPRKLRLVSTLPRENGGKLRREALLALFREPERSHATSPATNADSAQLELRVPTGGPRFDGHFPDQPILPAVALLHDLVLPAVRNVWPDLDHPTEARRLKFLRPLRGGEHVTVTLERSETKVQFQLREHEHSVATGTLCFPSSASPSARTLGPAALADNDPDVR